MSNMKEMERNSLKLILLVISMWDGELGGEGQGGGTPRFISSI